ncbi:MAG: hypothetical protein HFJ54_02460 [Clostridia bacterium]|nr:hypothetical protein [Clostridia bacterium]
MENAVSALKIAFAVFVFVLGLAILFSMTSKAQETAKFLVAEADKTTYYDYYEENDELVDENGNRIVSFSDIIPALYRYSQENYGVTIVDNGGNIVARFDLDTEVICNNWETSSAFSKYNKYKFVLELERIFTEVNTEANRIHANTINTSVFAQTPQNVTTDAAGKITYAEIDNNANNRMINIFDRLYSQHTSRYNKKTTLLLLGRKYGMDCPKD